MEHYFNIFFLHSSKNYFSDYEKQFFLSYTMCKQSL